MRMSFFRNMTPPSERSVPLSLRAYFFTGSVLLCIVLAFALLCRAQYRRGVPVDPGAWDEACPDTLLYDISGHCDASGYHLDGYAFIDGERLDWVNDFVALYHAGTGKYLRFPTLMVWSDAAAALQSAQDNRAGYAGIGAYAAPDSLAHPAGEYEVCFLYATNHHHILVHTGKTLLEAVS